MPPHPSSHPPSSFCLPLPRPAAAYCPCALLADSSPLPSWGATPTCRLVLRACSLLSEDSTCSCMCLLRQHAIRTVLVAPSYEVRESSCSVPQTCSESTVCQCQHLQRVQQIAVMGVSSHWCVSATHHIILPPSSRTSRPGGRRQLLGEEALDQSGENEGGICYCTVTASSF